MARKPKQTAAKVQPSSESIEAASLRPEPTRTPGRSLWSILVSPTTSRAFALVVLAALYSTLSQLILSPVYGSIPSSLYHKYGVIGSAILAFTLRGILPKWIERCLPMFAFWIPSIHYISFHFSATFGNPRGPLLTELVTCFPLITLSLYMSAKVFEELDLGFLPSGSVEEAAPSMVFYLLFTVIERNFRDVLPKLMHFGFLTSRIGLQVVIGVVYGLLLPKSLFWPAIPSVVLTMTMNVHNPLQRTTNLLNDTLALHHYTVLERHESVTGYLSVLEDNQKKFRVLRCDHSLLGGQWLDTPKSADRKVEEPIYAVFTMMEAVRLVEPPKSSKAPSGSQKTALNIGLGIGTAPAALITHGVNTTIVELDPIIHSLAIRHFNLPKHHQYVIGDAVGFVEYETNQKGAAERYDYILHDVFTGGAVPTSLFTVEFLTSLSKLLKLDGTIAINYAGDLNLPSAAMIHRTIGAVYPNCRIFREEPETEPKSGQDFTNLVYFCAHPSNKEPIRFRKPVTADYLGSGARQQFLVPKHELNAKEKFRPNVELVSRRGRSTKELDKWQAQSALGHWHLMRTVVPDAVWENW